MMAGGGNVRVRRTGSREGLSERGSEDIWQKDLGKRTLKLGCGRLGLPLGQQRGGCLELLGDEQ